MWNSVLRTWHLLSTPLGGFIWSSSLYSCALCAHGNVFLLEFDPKGILHGPSLVQSKAQPVEVTGESLQNPSTILPQTEAPWEHLQALSDSKSSQNGPPWGLMLGEQALGSPPFPFMAKISLWSEDKPAQALGQAVVPPESIPSSFITGLAEPFLPQFQGNQERDGKIRAHGNQNLISEVVERVC